MNISQYINQLSKNGNLREKTVDFLSFSCFSCPFEWKAEKKNCLSPYIYKQKMRNEVSYEGQL